MWPWLCCTKFSERSPLIGRHSAVQPKGMGLVKITQDINPKYDGLERSCPRDSKNVSYVDVGLV